MEVQENKVYLSITNTNTGVLTVFKISMKTYLQIYEFLRRKRLEGRGLPLFSFYKKEGNSNYGIEELKEFLTDYINKEELEFIKNEKI